VAFGEIAFVDVIDVICVVSVLEMSVHAIPSFDWHSAVWDGALGIYFSVGCQVDEEKAILTIWGHCWS